MTRTPPIDSVEDHVRAALAALRPAGEAPLALRARVEAIPERVGSVGIVSRLRRAFTAPSSVAPAVAVVAVAILAVAYRPVAAPLTGGAQPPAAFDPTVEGPGILNTVPTLYVAFALSVLTALALAVRWRSIGSFDTWRDMGRGLLLIVLVGLPAVMALQPPLKDLGGSSGTALGYGLVVYPAPGLDGPEVRYVSADPGAPMIAFFDVTNTGALPVTLEGIVPRAGDDPAGPHWTSLALARDRNVFPNQTDQLLPFTAQVIAPNDRITLYLIGKAGHCAYGPGYTLDTVGATGFTSMSRDIQLAYSILGLTAQSTFTMPFQLVEPERDLCA